jgi:hypothetical protein
MGHDSEVPSLFSRDSSLLQALRSRFRPLLCLMLRLPAPLAQASSKQNEERLNEEEMAKVCCTAYGLGGWISTGSALATDGWVPLMEGGLGGAYPPPIGSPTRPLFHQWHSAIYLPTHLPTHSIGFYPHSIHSSIYPAHSSTIL